MMNRRSLLSSNALRAAWQEGVVRLRTADRAEAHHAVTDHPASRQAVRMMHSSR